MATIVDITLPVHNGAPFLGDQIRSIQEQTHQAWRLWIRDDGSTDGSHDIALEFQAADPRVRVWDRDGACLGRTVAPSWLLEHLPEDAERIFCCDADDVWLPHKIERSLEALERAEDEHAGPILVHSDMAVVDAELRPLAPSFWAHSGIDPEAADFRRMLVANVATGPTLLLNRPLLDLALPIPAQSPHHDWWLALVAAAFGRLAILREPTVLYRRHSANVTGALPARPLLGGVDVLHRAATAQARTPAIRRWIQATAAQAEVFLERYGERLPAADAVRVRDLAAIPGRGLLRRKLAVLRHHALAERGVISGLGLLWRA